MSVFRLFAPLCLLVLATAPVAAQSSTPAPITAVVLDTTGAAVVSVPVTIRDSAGQTRRAETDAEGRVVVSRAGSEVLTLTVAAPGFDPATVAVTPSERAVRIVLQPSGVRETVTVGAVGGRAVTVTGMKMPTPLRDVPQAVSVVTQQQIRDLSMQGMADVVRYVPGTGVAQGESNRDAPVLRGMTTTGDFFVDGIRDDAQYFRDLYNVERVEVLKGPNAMAFGRGGVGGIVNRVTKRPEWAASRELTLQAGTWANRRITADLGDRLGAQAAFRVTGVFEDSGSYRQGSELERQGITPSIAATFGERTMVRAAVEYFHDRRTADRGVPSLSGRPLPVDPSAFFGNADLSYAEATVNLASLAVTRLLGTGIELHNRTQVVAYDKFYQNVFPGAVNAATSTVALSAYNHATNRTNLFNQTDLLVTLTTGQLSHRIAAGVEVGRQSSESLRNTGYFTSVSSLATSISVPLSEPAVTIPVTFQPSATDADANSVAIVGALYVQDQVRLFKQVELVAGLRYDRFQVDAINRRTATAFDSRDNLLSPRLGVIYKPRETVALYSSYSIAYQPRAGEQLSSLTLTNRTLDPETFRNVEVGAKWDVRGLSVTGAIYRVVRSNVAIASPETPGVMLLVDGQRMKGLELGVSGSLTERWSVIGGYAWQQGRILTTQSPTIRAGAVLGQVPKHSFSIWNRYDVSSRIGGGLGLIHRGDMFVAPDNAVVLPAFTRADGALFVQLSRRLKAQVNVENLLDTRYFAAAHSNNNITPGSPRAVRVTLTTTF